MNYEKKRKRSNGRQARKGLPINHVWFDEYERLHAIIDKAIKDGILPPVTFDPTPHIHFGVVEEREYTQVWPPIDKL